MRLPGRSGGLPRSRRPPENNSVQNPAVTRGIQRFTGLRQAHVAPALSDGLAVQLVAGDIREDPRTGIPESYASFHEQIPDGVNVKRAVFCNPLDSDRIAVLRRLHVYAAEDLIALPAGPASIVYDLVPLGLTTMGVLQPGQRLVSGYTQAGVAPPPPLIGTDILFPPKKSSMGWKSVDPLGISGAYIWRGVIMGGAGWEIEEEFEGNRGPRMIVFPGGIFETYVVSTDWHGYFNMWWDEYPLT